MSQWSTGLFECCSVKDVGVLCCFNHCCCGPCVWGDALGAAGLNNANAYIAGQVAGLALSSTGYNTAAAFGTAATSTTGYAGRAALANKYGVEESTFDALFARLCCPLCAQIQEVNTVMEKERLVYGCAGLESHDSVHKPPPAPKPVKARRV